MQLSLWEHWWLLWATSRHWRQRTHVLSLIFYTGANATQKVPTLISNTGGDEAAGSLPMSIAPKYSKKCNLFSWEDELSLDGTPLVEVMGIKPTNDIIMTSTHLETMRHHQKASTHHVSSDPQVQQYSSWCWLHRGACYWTSRNTWMYRS